MPVNATPAPLDDNRPVLTLNAAFVAKELLEGHSGLDMSAEERAVIERASSEDVRDELALAVESATFQEALTDLVLTVREALLRPGDAG